MKYLKRWDHLLAVFLCLCAAVVFTGCSSVQDDAVRELSEVYFNLGNAHYRLNELDGAERAYLQALRHDPHLYAAAYNLASLYLEKRNFSSAERYISQLLSQNPRNTKLLRIAAELYERRNEMKRAADAYERILSEDPGDIDARIDLVQLYIDNDELQKAEEAVSWFSVYGVYTKETLLLLWNVSRLRDLESVSALHWLELAYEQDTEDLETAALLLRQYLDIGRLGRAADLAVEVPSLPESENIVSPSEAVEEKSSADAASAEFSDYPQEMLYQSARYYAAVQDMGRLRFSVQLLEDVGFSDESKLQELRDMLMTADAAVTDPD